ncbi:Os12g0264500, partial [Oryza sativa Japonica Group]
VLLVVSGVLLVCLCIVDARTQLLFPSSSPIPFSLSLLPSFSHPLPQVCQTTTGTARLWQLRETPLVVSDACRTVSDTS